MSKLEANQVDPATGTTLTLGTSGDTIAIPSGVTIANSGTATGFSTPGISSSADATAITITSAERVGIGETSPDNTLHVNSTSSTVTKFERDGGTNGSLTIGFPSQRATFSASGNIALNTNSAERMRIDSSGNLMVGKTSTSDTVTGSQFTTNGALVNVLNASGYNLVNRQADDGVLIYFKQANSTEGNISVSGTTVSYNGFTGTHWTRLIDNSKPTILKGTVLETLDEMVDWYNLEFDVITQDDEGNDVTNPQKIPHLLTGSQSAGDIITYNHNGTDYQATIVREADIKHMKSKVSDTTDAKNVYGVFSHWDFGDDDGINDIIIASVGSFVVRIKSGETISKGDLLQSNGDGTAKVQTDDNIKSSSFAKVLSTTKIETYEDGSFIVPCSLMC
jgi:hypothetical protein